MPCQSTVRPKIGFTNSFGHKQTAAYPHVYQMNTPTILASGSGIRAQLLVNAGVVFSICKPMIDEQTAIESLTAAGQSPRNIADALAQAKALKISGKNPDALVVGCDQTLELEGQLLTKPLDIDDARRQLNAMSGRRHILHSAAVIAQNGKPQWRHIGLARLYMRQLSAAYIDQYLDENWDSVRHCVGCYKLEERGVRLMSKVEGDYFTVLGLPLVEILGYLTQKGVLDG